MQDNRFDSAGGGRPTIGLVAATGRRPATAREKYLKDWKLVKRARFNAAKRFERKQSASTLAFAFAGVIGFLIPFYTLLFKGSLTTHTKNVLDFTAYVTGSLSLIIGLIEQAKDYPAKARRFDLCGRRVNSVLRRLTTTPITYDQELHPLLEEYERALEECNDNHDDIDYDIAKAQQELEDSPNKEKARKRVGRLKMIERVQLYWLYAATWVLPMLIGGVLWWTLYPESPAP